MSKSSLPEGEKQTNRLQQIIKVKPWLLPVVMVSVGAMIAATVIISIQANQAREAAEAEEAAEQKEMQDKTRRANFFYSVGADCNILRYGRDDTTTGNGYFSIGDGGDSLYIDGDGEESFGLGYESLMCAIEGIGTPSHVIQEMLETRSLDGRLDAEWDGFSVSWSYHPDDGLDLIFVQTGR